MGPAYANPAFYVAWYAADGRRVAWRDFETATEAHAAYAAPRADAASVYYGTLSADGGFEPFIVRALTPDAPFVP